LCLPQWTVLKLRLARLGCTPQLQLSSIPQTGIVALKSAKGTEKTKLVAALTQDSPKLLAVTNLISLARNLAERLLDRQGRAASYRGDLDRAKGTYISASGYATRLTTCLPSLLAINPDQFQGCDLVLDEAVQLVRCLIESSICNQDGKRPALLARLEELLKVAGRVILADADLDDATLNGCVAKNSSHAISGVNRSQSLKFFYYA